jgi:hypothetical protein
VGQNLDAIRAAVEDAKVIAAEFHTAEAKFFEEDNTTAVLTTQGRARKPRPSAFSAGNQTEWATKRIVVLKVPLDATTGVIRKGLICQLSTPDGDPTINHINFRVESSLVSQFAAEREVILSTEVAERPRIVP